MVPGDPCLALVVVFEHREIDDPQWLPALFGEAAVVTDLPPQRAQRIVDDFFPVGGEEDQVSRLRASALDDGVQDLG